MIEFGANFRLSGAPDYLVTLALLFIAGIGLRRALGGVSVPHVAGKVGAVLNPLLLFVQKIVRMIPYVLMGIAAAALAANTLPRAWEMIVK